MSDGNPDTGPVVRRKIGGQHQDSHASTHQGGWRALGLRHRLPMETFCSVELVAIFAAKQQQRPLIQRVDLTHMHSEMRALIRINFDAGRDQSEVDSHAALRAGVWSGAVDDALGEENKVPRRNFDGDGTLGVCLEFESEVHFVEAFIAAEAYGANLLMRSGIDLHTAVFTGGVVERNPDRELEELITIRRMKGRFQVVFHHVGACLMPLNRIPSGRFQEDLRTPATEVRAKQLSCALENGRFRQKVEQEIIFEMEIAV